MIYDFDGTLSPANMQEFGLLQAFDKDPALFWQKSNRMSTDNDASEILCYMKTMTDEAKKAGIHLTRENFQKFGSMVKLYPGVKEWFSLINDYGSQCGLEVEHYINSSGLTEMIEGTEIYHEFKKVFACSFLYENGEAVWPGVAVDYTAKTQFLFKINKGVMSIRDHTLVNRFVLEKDRPVPGHSIAVYNPDGHEKDKSERLLTEQRVHFACPADYSKGKIIYNVVTAIIDKIKADLAVESLKD